jgi:stage V sporulation protein G
MGKGEAAMEISEVRVFLVTHEDERLLAYATLTFDESFVVRDLRVIRGNNGLFVAMPSRKRQDGTYSDVAHPLTPDLRERIEHAVIGAFELALARHKQEASAAKAAPPPAEAPQKIAV